MRCLKMGKNETFCEGKRTGSRISFEKHFKSIQDGLEEEGRLGIKIRAKLSNESYQIQSLHLGCIHLASLLLVLLFHCSNFRIFPRLIHVHEVKDLLKFE